MSKHEFSISGDKTTLLHIGDVHLGNKQYSSEQRKDDYISVFKESIDIAIQENVDAVFHTGDLFDSPNPDIEEITVCVEEIQKLKENDVPFLSIVGNHERKWDSQWMDLFSKEENTYRLGKEPVLVGDVALFGIDSLRENEWVNTENFELTAVDDSYTTVLCMHELLSPLVRADIATCSVSDVLDKLLFVPDILALGDSHTPNSETINDCYVYYSGAIEKTSVTDSNNHHVIKLTVENNTFETKNIPVSNNRPFKEITLELTEDGTMEYIESQLEKNSLTSYKPTEKHPVCVLYLEGNKPETVSLTDIKKLALDMGAEIVNSIDNTETEFDVGEVSTKADANSLSENISKRMENIELTEKSEHIRELIESDDEISDFEEETNEIITGDENED